MVSSVLLLFNILFLEILRTLSKWLNKRYIRMRSLYLAATFNQIAFYFLMPIFYNKNSLTISKTNNLWIYIHFDWRLTECQLKKVTYKSHPFSLKGNKFPLITPTLYREKACPLLMEWNSTNKIRHFDNSTSFAARINLKAGKLLIIS